LANRHECCLEPVLTLDEALELEHTRQRAIFVESPHPSEGLMRIPLTPLKMTDFSAHVRRPAPERGQHNHEILRALGFDDDAIAEMTRR
jgi:formyl-CoA transferase